MTFFPFSLTKEEIAGYFFIYLKLIDNLTEKQLFFCIGIFTFTMHCDRQSNIFDNFEIDLYGFVV